VRREKEVFKEDGKKVTRGCKKIEALMEIGTIREERRAFAGKMNTLIKWADSLPWRRKICLTL
jgi:hypothetical protein